MILHRVFPHNRRAGESEPGGPLWWPREIQGDGRHDNPELYGCMYLSETPVAPVAEALAPFRNAGELVPEMLARGGLPLALATLSLPDDARLVDLDEPRTLIASELRPSLVATRDRTLTRSQAASLYESHPDALGLRWWSALESLWLNVTLFDRAAPPLAVSTVIPVSRELESVREAASALGLPIG